RGQQALAERRRVTPPREQRDEPSSGKMDRMGTFFGKRPDRTAAIARSIASSLEPGETVLAAVHVQRPGTLASAMSGAASGAVAGALGTGVAFSGDGSAQTTEWRQTAERAGVDAECLQKAVWLILALTTRRLLLVRRSRLTGRPKGVLAAWPVHQVKALRVPPNGDTIDVELEGVTLALELPLAHKFLPDVYLQLPALLDQARAGSS